MGRTGTINYKYSYDRASNVKKRMNYKNGSFVNYTYDTADRMSDLDIYLSASVRFSHEHFTLDNMNRLTGVAHTQGNTTNDPYSYYADGQLHTAAYGWTTRGFTYNLDAAGNRTSVIDQGVTKNYTPNALNQYTAAGTDTVANGSVHEISTYKGVLYKY